MSLYKNIKIIILFIGICVKSQQVQVEYVLEGLDIKDPTFSTFNLDIKDNSSKFYPISMCEPFDANSVYMQVHMEGNKLTILDGTSLPLEVSLNYDFKWRILDNSKIENNLKVQEAIGVLNGKQIKAWFTNDIPLNQGPFIFNGLPGLITEIIIPDRNISFKFSSISDGNEKCDKSIYQTDKQRKELTLKRYKEIFDGINSNYDALIKKFEEIGFGAGTAPLKQNSSDIKKFNMLREIL
ncbi:GLPGLI family protein [Chryseobacterium sp. A301]